MLQFEIIRSGPCFKKWTSFVYLGKTIVTSLTKGKWNKSEQLQTPTAITDALFELDLLFVIPNGPEN